MADLVILSKLEQEHLLHVIEASLQVRDPRQFFLWSQGQFQALLPHRVMVCLQFGVNDELLHAECLHSAVLDHGLRARLCGGERSLALRLARHCRASGTLSAMLDADADADADAAGLATFQAELQKEGFDNLLLHASEQLPGGSSFFLLLGLPFRPGSRHAYFFQLLLPHLHLSLQRLGIHGYASQGAPLRPVSAREAQILYWLREGKSNDEIGMILGISGLTVKNHLQRLYKLLGVSNRTHAIARCMALRLLERPAPLPHAA